MRSASDVKAAKKVNNFARNVPLKDDKKQKKGFGVKINFQTDDKMQGSSSAPKPAGKRRLCFLEKCVEIIVKLRNVELL